MFTGWPRASAFHKNGPSISYRFSREMGKVGSQYAARAAAQRGVTSMIKRNLSSRRHGTTGRADAVPTTLFKASDIKTGHGFAAILAAISVAAFVGCGQDDEPRAPEMDMDTLE